MLYLQVVATANIADPAEKVELARALSGFSVIVVILTDTVPDRIRLDVRELEMKFGVCRSGDGSLR